MKKAIKVEADLKGIKEWFHEIDLVVQNIFKNILIIQRKIKFCKSK